jgi:hypothetical protein
MTHDMAVGLGFGAIVGTGLGRTAGLGVGGGVGVAVATGIAVAGGGVGVSVAAVAGAADEGADTAVAPPHAASPNVAMVDSKRRRERMSKYPREAGAPGGPLTHEVPEQLGVRARLQAACDSAIGATVREGRTTATRTYTRSVATVAVTNDLLTVHVAGVDRVLAFKSTITVPLAHVTEITQDATEAGKTFHGLRVPGTAIPGVLTAGSFLKSGEWTFWDVHDPDKAVILSLNHEHYSRLVVGVDDPGATVEAVRAALAKSSAG